MTADTAVDAELEAIDRPRFTNDWVRIAVGSRGDCARCGRVGDFRLPYTYPAESSDPLFDVLVCLPCHPGWLHATRRLGIGHTFTGEQLEAHRAGVAARADIEARRPALDRRSRKARRYGR